MGLTTDRNDPGLRAIEPSGMQAKYLVLSNEERAKGFVRRLMRSYKHLACGGVTTMSQAIAETYARNPKFYGGTFCCNCGTHFALKHWDPIKQETVAAFLWVDDGTPVGSTAEQAAEFLEAKRQAEAEKNIGDGI